MSERRRARSRSPLIYVLIIVLVTGGAAAIVLGLFHVRQAQVIGNSRYESSVITDALMYDFPTHNTLYLGWKYRNAAYESRTPYLSGVQARMITPWEIRFTVTEKPLVGYVQYNGSMVYFDADGIVLEITDKEYDGTVLLTGIAMDEPVLYQKLPVLNSVLLRTILNVSRMMNDSGLAVDSISFDDNANMTANIGTVAVLLGQDEYLDEKVSNLKIIYDKVASQSGTLNMSAFTGNNEPVTFSEGYGSAAGEGSDINAPETEAETEGAQTGSEDEWAGEQPEGTQGEAMVDAGSPEESADGSVEPADEGTQSGEVVGVEGFMVFDSSGTLRYDARVINGQVLDAYGNPIDGCYINENGNVVDAYWNEIDPMTGTLAE